MIIIGLTILCLVVLENACILELHVFSIEVDRFQ